MITPLRVTLFIMDFLIFADEPISVDAQVVTANSLNDEGGRLAADCMTVWQLESIIYIG